VPARQPNVSHILQASKTNIAHTRTRCRIARQHPRWFRCRRPLLLRRRLCLVVHAPAMLARCTLHQEISTRHVQYELLAVYNIVEPSSAPRSCTHQSAQSSRHNAHDTHLGLFGPCLQVSARRTHLRHLQSTVSGSTQAITASPLTRVPLSPVSWCLVWVLRFWRSALGNASGCDRVVTTTFS